MNQVALAVDVRLHLGVPPAGPVAVVNPGINEIFDDERHEKPSVQLTITIRPKSPGEGRGATLLRTRLPLKCTRSLLYRFVIPASNGHLREPRVRMAPLTCNLRDGSGRIYLGASEQ